MLPRFGLFPVRSPLLGESRLISVPPGTEMFQFPGLAPLARWPASPPVGFPHSGILGLRLMCSSPRLIAAYHALHRLSMPRHPPCALLRLISNSFVVRSCVRTSRPVLIPHTRFALASEPIIHPSIVKELDRSQPASLGKGSGSVKRSKCEQAARECGRLLRLFRPPSPKAGAYSRSPERR